LRYSFGSGPINLPPLEVGRTGGLASTDDARIPATVIRPTIRKIANATTAATGTRSRFSFGTQRSASGSGS